MLYDIIGKSRSSNGSQAPAPTERPQLAYARLPEADSFPAQPQQPSGANVLACDVEIQGILRFTHDLTMDGRLDGEIHSDGCLTIGENAVIRGTVHARNVVVFGRVEGNISALERCELRAQSDVTGDITAGTLGMEQGAAFTGQSAVGQWHGFFQEAPAVHAAEPEVTHDMAPPVEEMPAQPEAMFDADFEDVVPTERTQSYAELEPAMPY